MVQFEERIKRERWDQWSNEYLDYALLKRRVKDASAYQDGSRKELVAALTNVFQGLFDNEVEKMIKFYKQKVVDIQTEGKHVAATSDKVACQAQNGAEGGSASPSEQVSEIEEALLKVHETALDITNLLSYVSLNFAAVRKILKKAAKKLPTQTTYGPGLLTLRIEHPHQPGWKILQGTFLPVQAGQDLEDMRKHAPLLKVSSQLEDAFDSLRQAYRDLLSAHPDLQGHASLPASSRRPSLERLSKSMTFKYVPQPRMQNSGQSSDRGPDGQASGDQMLLDLESQLDRMQQAQKLSQAQAGLVHCHNYQQTLAGIFEPAPSDESALADTWGLYLNCINSGLYMANYNVVIPTITRLCTHIGVSTSSSGLIIGSCDVATVVSTLLYSKWTDYSYKWPLLASAVACIIGNVAYCLSYDSGSLTLLLAGRLITGFGSARAVNRNYIAMFVSKDERTWASALFVSLSAAGMALGPLLALPLARAPDMRLLGLTFGPITLGGWVMSAAWLLFILVSMVMFRDPLKEQQQKEAASKDEDATNDSLRKPLLQGQHEDDQNGEVPDLERGEHHADKTDQTGLEKVMHSSMNTVTLESDHDFPRHSGLYKILDSPMFATTCCIFLCFILKTCQQAYIDGLPVFTESQSAYQWSDGECGIMIGVLGLSAPIVNQLVAKSATKISDRAITVGSIISTGIGAVMLMGGPYPLWTFFAGGAALFMGTIVLEGVSMSLVSKVIDERMSKGFWNAGLLSTQAGTTGRLSGNLLLSACARITGSDTYPQLGHLANTMFGAVLGFMVFSLAYVALCYKRLVG